jgi:DNA-binding response OmpR family regulator
MNTEMTMSAPRRNDVSTVWILEDDETLAGLYREILGPENKYKLFSSAAELSEGLGAKTLEASRLLIADLHLPEGSFVDFLKKHEDLVRTTPIMVISGDGEEESLEECFALGVSEYLLKPVRHTELRVKAERIISRSRLTLDPSSFTVRYGGQISEVLTAREFQILNILSKAASRGLTRSELTQDVWGAQLITRKALDVHLHNLRKKIRDIGLEVKFFEPETYRLIS